MNPESDTVYFSLLSGTHVVDHQKFHYTPRQVLRVYAKFLRRANFPFRIYFPRLLQTQTDYEQLLREREARYQLTRTGQRKSGWSMEFEEGCVFWSYRTLENTQLDLYLLFHEDTLTKVILELGLPAERARTLRTHYTLAKQTGFWPCAATEIT